MEKIQIYKAREHNLRDVSLSIPRDKLVVFTGVSGSGKSSLAFDTIFTEGQRRYVESLSSYARQFIGQFEKPSVESIEGLSPTVAIDQKSVSRSPRSTVGTVTEIYDFLRVIYARIGTPYCPVTGQEITPHSLKGIVERVCQFPDGSKIQILSPVVRGRKGEYNALFTQLRKEGYVRVRIDGELKLLEELPETHRLEKTLKHNIDVMIDRLVLKHDDAVHQRLMKAVESAMTKSEGFVIVQKLPDDPDGEVQESFYSKFLASPVEDIGVEEMAPRLFSFNSPYGACPTCDGLGIRLDIAERLLVPDTSKPLSKGAVVPFQKFAGRYYQAFLRKLGKQYGIRIDVPYADLNKAEKELLMHGSPDAKAKLAGLDDKELVDLTLSADEEQEDWFDFAERFDGVIPILKRRYLYGTEAAKAYIEQFMTETHCPECRGARLKPFSLAVRLGGKNIYELCTLSIGEALKFIRELPDQLDETKRTIGKMALYEVEQRLRFLMDVGLDYLTLARSASTLSGGEAQRIRLASQIGAGLSGVLYVLDEPSIGLHQYNNHQLIKTLCKLRDQGNSLIVVEHDEDTIRTADWVVDIGPGAGVWGGRIIAEGTPEDLTDNPNSMTGQYLSGRRAITVPKVYRKGNGQVLAIEGATLHNLKNINVSIPLGTLTVITGLSGSGKSTLVFDLIYQAMKYHLGRHGVPPQGMKTITGIEHIDKCIDIDQSPIGRTSRSNPATYTGMFDWIRAVFANTEGAQVRGFNAGRFSFNVKTGRCSACNGEGHITLEMNFMPNVTILCDRCNGKRYNEETLAVTYQGKTIADVLAMTVDEACEFFKQHPKIYPYLSILREVGLGYIQLGQSATTLSGGEAQRLKLAAEFARKSTGKTLYLLDEPSVGLHWADLEKLLNLLNRLVDQGNTVIMIEHNLDLIKASDYVIDMGPEGGERGGEVIATGTPKDIAKAADSYTGQFLKTML